VGQLQHSGDDSLREQQDGAQRNVGTEANDRACFLGI
jgi:hypothetical protein